MGTKGTGTKREFFWGEYDKLGRKIKRSRPYGEAASRSKKKDSQKDIKKEFQTAQDAIFSGKYDGSFVDDPVYEERYDIWKEKITLDDNKNYRESQLTEMKIIQMFPPGKRIEYEDNDYIVEHSGKPRPQYGGGEGKTDAYIALRDEDTNEIKEYKISIKQTNSEHIENKMSLQRAKDVFGDKGLRKFEKELSESAQKILDNDTPFKNNYLTIGYRADIKNKKGGYRSITIPLDPSEKKELLSGEKLEERKVNSKVGNEIIERSGAANYMLVGEHVDYDSPDDVLDNIVDIDGYAHSDECEMYLYLGAVNYYDTGKIEGDRSLAIAMDYQFDMNNDNKISVSLNYMNPLEVKTREVIENIDQRVLDAAFKR